MTEKSPEIIMKEFIVDEFINDFMNHYAIALLESDLHPEQANNEARNAFVHLGRFLLGDEPEENLQKAKDHIKRGKRDCLKIAIISKTSSLNRYVRNIEFVEQVSLRKQKNQLLKVTAKRVTYYIQETIGKPVSSNLAGLYKELTDIEEFLIDNYKSSDNYKKIGLFKRWTIKISKWVLGIAGAIFIGVIVAIIHSKLFPSGDVYEETTAIIQKILDYISLK